MRDGPQCCVVVPRVSTSWQRREAAFVARSCHANGSNVQDEARSHKHHSDVNRIAEGDDQSMHATCSMLTRDVTLLEPFVQQRSIRQEEYRSVLYTKYPLLPELFGDILLEPPKNL